MDESKRKIEMYLSIKKHNFEFYGELIWVSPNLSKKDLLDKRYAVL